MLCFRSQAELGDPEGMGSFCAAEQPFVLCFSSTPHRMSLLLPLDTVNTILCSNGQAELGSLDDVILLNAFASSLSLHSM